MAFSSSNLKKIAGGATGIFYYDSTDAIGTIDDADYFLGATKKQSASSIVPIDDADYFLGATNELKVGDIIIAVGSTGGTRTVDMLVVQTNTGSALTTVLGTQSNYQ